MGFEGRYPLDWESLRKGDRIEAAQLETVFGVNAKLASYRSRQVDLAFLIENKMAELGCKVTVACVKTSIHILTDEEAVPYLAKRLKKLVKGTKRQHRKLTEVDRGQLPDDQQEAFDRGIVKSAATLAGMLGGYRRPPVLVYEKTTPSRLEPPKQEN